VKIGQFDILVLFLKVCAVSQALCSVFMDTILNLAIVQFLMKKKGDAL
jgi:hypothetical protein